MSYSKSERLNTRKMFILPTLIYTLTAFHKYTHIFTECLAMEYYKLILNFMNEIKLNNLPPNKKKTLELKSSVKLQDKNLNGQNQLYFHALKINYL